MILKDYPSAPLRSELEGRGFRVWVDEGEMRAGDSLFERIATAIKDSSGTAGPLGVSVGGRIYSTHVRDVGAC